MSPRRDDFSWRGDDEADRPPDEWLRKSIKNARWLQEQEFPPLSWAVPGLIPEGMGLFTGPPKVGKSYVSLDIALAHAAGGIAFGNIRVGPPRPVLLLALEDSDRRLQQRMSDLLAGQSAFPSLLDYATDPDPEEVQPLIELWLHQHGAQRPLVILDTLGRIMGSPAGNEGAYRHDYRVASGYKALVDAHPGACLLIVHHIRKQAGADWMDSTSGTNGLNGAADWTLNLSAQRNEPTGYLRVTGRDVPEGQYAIRRTIAGNWSVEGSSLAEAEAVALMMKATEGLSDRSAAVLAEVNNHPQGVGPTHVADYLDMEPKHAGTYLKRLVDQGRVKQVKRGLYAPVESVETVENDPHEQGSEALPIPVSTLSTLSTPPPNGHRVVRRTVAGEPVWFNLDTKQIVEEGPA